MKKFTVTEVRESRGWVCVVHSSDDNPGELHEFQYQPDRLSTFMAEYALDDPGEAVELLLHSVRVEAWVASLPPADDPAVVAGWVTTTDPDSEAVNLFNARTGTDAREAHRARVVALRAQVETIEDPHGLLAQVPAHDSARVREYRKIVDVTRWTNVYGGLPVPPSSRIPIRQARG